MLYLMEMASCWKNLFFPASAKLVGIPIFVLLSWVAIGQQVPVSSQDSLVPSVKVFDFSVDLEDQLPPLDSLLVIARENSPMLDKYHSFTQAQEAKVSLARKSWSSNIQVQGNYSMGNQSLLLSGTASSDLNQLSNGYRFGVNVGIPLFDLISRPSKIRLAQSEAQASVDQLNEARQMLDKEVISVYYQLITSYRQMRTTQMMVEKSVVSEMLAQKKLDENQIPLADYTRISEIRAAAENRKYESEKLFFDAFFTLQVMLGVSLESLKL
jgi:outer membrane protein TolC